MITDESLDTHILEDKKRRHVRSLTQRAIAKGFLKRESCCQLCEASDVLTQAHHVDYGRPYDVLWLCSTCHGAVHRKDHALNPDNNIQSELPHFYRESDSVHVSFSLPVKSFSLLKQAAEAEKRSVAEVIKNEVLKKFREKSKQLEFNF